jgi:hypothetical protein
LLSSGSISLEATASFRFSTQPREHPMNRNRIVLLALSACAAAALVACGGSGSAAPAASSTVSGSVVKGPVDKSDVCFYQLTGGVKGAQIACVKTDATGAYTAQLAYVGDVLVEASGGTYTDEATGASATLSEPMQVVLSAQSGTTTGIVTPLTTVAVSLSKNLSGGLTGKNFSAAASNVASQFQLGTADITKLKPDVSSATTDAYGRALRSVSQYVKNGGTLKTFMAFADPTGLATAYSGAYKTATGQTLTFSFNGADKIVVSGTGLGGGSGTCGVNVKGSDSGEKFDFDFCLQGVPAGSCGASLASIETAVKASIPTGGGLTYSYTYSSTCAPGATTISLQ